MSMQFSRRTSFHWWLNLGFLCLLVIGSMLVPQGFVLAQESGAEPDPGVVLYAETIGLTYEEAQHRLALQIEMSVLESQVIEGEPTYAGSWMEHQPEFGLVIGFAAPNGTALLQKYLEGVPWAELVRVKQMPYTIGELLAISEQIQLAAFKTEIPFESGTNIQLAKTTFYTPYPEELQRLLEADESIQQYLDEIEYVYQATLSTPATDQEAAAFTIYLPTVQR